MNLHQTPEDIIKAATPEQRILWNQIYLMFGEKIGISQFEFTGQIAGNELSIFAAGRYYLALEMSMHSTAAHSATPGLVILHNRLNAGISSLAKNVIAYNTATNTMNYYSQDIIVKNMHFSRLALTIYTYISFKGYRITY